MLTLDTDKKNSLLAYSSTDTSPFVALGKVIGVDGLEALFEILGGLKAHIPYSSNFWSRLERERRNDEVWAKFTGHNHKALATEFCLSERRIRMILNRSRHIYQRCPESSQSVRLSKEHHAVIAKLANDQGITMQAAITKALSGQLANADSII